jgi:hypothetical protein
MPDADPTVYARIHPDDWKQLDERFDSVKTYTDTRVEAIEDRTETLEDTVNGNGQPGIVTRLARLEGQVKLAVGVVTAALAAVAGAVVTLLQPKQ